MPMQFTGKSFRNFAGLVLAILALTIVSQAQEVASQNNSTIKIKNFGQMDERFYRGAQPGEEDYKDLAALGIKTVIDLQAEPKAYEKSMVESLGMKYINIPMADKKYPTEDAARTFLKIASDPSTGKFFVHCAGGRHRTGAMGAVYRYQLYDWNFDQVYAEMKRMVPGFNLAIEPVAMFDQAYFDSLPIEARELGCDPDFNAWTRLPNERPVTDQPFRCAGGHVHIGWLPEEEFADPMDPNHFDDCCDVAKQMDYYLGMWSLTWDKDQTRRSLYGKAGSFRPKPYGCEYRSLSNLWLQTEDLQGWVFDAATKGMNDLNNGRRAFDEQGSTAQHAIDDAHYNWHREWRDLTGLTMPPGGYWGKKAA